MPSSAIRRLEIAKESNYMSRFDGLPDADELSWSPVSIADASQLVAVGTTTTTQYDASKPGFGSFPGAALVDPQLGKPVKSGTITIDWLLRGGLSADSELKSMLLLLGTRMSHAQRTKGVVASGAVSQYGQPTFSATQASPRFFAYELADGRVEYGVARAGTAPTSEPRPDLVSAMTGTKMITADAESSSGTLYEYWLKPIGGEAALDYLSAGGRYTVALRLTGDGWQQVCFGCSMTALTISADGDGRAIKLSATIDCPCVVDVDPDAINTPAWPDVTDGPVLHSLGSPAIINATGFASPLTIEQSWCIAAWSLTLTWTTAGAACGSYWQGRAPLEATNLDAQLSLTIGHPSEDSRLMFTRWWEQQTLLTVSLPFGGDLDAEIPYGGALICLNCYVTSGDVSNPDLSGDLIQTTVTLGLSTAGVEDVPMAILGVF